MKITFLNHASFIIQEKNFKLCCDPYLFGSAFNNGWNLLKEENHDEQLKNLTHIFFSHEHPDHFAIPFLKKINGNDRSKITILYQETFDKRVKKFCESLGYKFFELKNKVLTNLNDDVSVICGKVPVYDSWINFKINDFNILNVNDCVLENPSLIKEINQTLKNEVDILFTQFSYASFASTKTLREETASNQLLTIKKQDDLIKPKFIVPFASFIYFSNSENKYMNDSINSVVKAYNFMNKNCKSKVVVMRPNQEWNGIDEVNNQQSIEYWKSIYENIENLNFSNEITNFDDTNLINKSKKYIEKLKKKNNFLIVKFLRLIGFFKDIKIFLTDKKKFFKFNIFLGLKEIEPENNIDKIISMHSNSLAFIFDYDYGFDTLIVNARFKSNFEYFQTVKKTFMLGTLNNTGRYLKMSNTYKYLNKNFILRCFEIFGLKKRVNPTS